MLNEEQKQAVSYLEGPLRILAGAGTGKTHTLVERICNLIDSKKISQKKILVLTFTNKAVHELKTRLISRNYHNINVLTFHSLSARLLRKFWKEDFTINDEEDPETLSFDDLLKKLLEIFENKEILEQAQALFEYVMVDEYQDSNELQIKILNNLCEKHKNICVVGDSDQTIYSWRGANVDTMLKFAEIYPDAKTITLETNYRNPDKILKSAENLISHNSNRLKKSLKAIKIEDTSTNLWIAKDSFEHSEMIIHLLESLLGSNSSMIDADNLDIGHDNHKYSFGDIAIMYRTQEQGKKIARILEAKGYPFQRSAMECFWESSEIKQFCDELEQLKKMEEFKGELKFSSWLKDRIDNFIEAKDLPVLKQNKLKILISFAIAFDGIPVKEALNSFIDERDTALEQDNLTNPDVLQLLTFHAAKGLEFPVVIIEGLQEGIIPYKKSIIDPYFLEEERRLLYVGMTRAKDNLHLLINTRNGEQSRFIKEIKEFQILSLPEHRILRLKKRKLKKAQMRMF